MSVRRLTGGQEFVRVAPAVYVEACWADDLATRCTGVLCAAPTAVLSHWTALAVHGLPVPGDVDPIHVTVPAGSARPRWPGVVGHRSRSVRPFLVDGLRVSGAVRAWCDAAALLTGPDLTWGREPDLADLVAAGDALRSRRPTTPQDVGNQLMLRPGGRGTGVARQALALLDPRAESAPESRLRVVLHLAGIAPPAVQHVVRGASGAFVARVDLAYPAAGVVVEYDGDHHRGRRQWQQDLARRERLEGLGWRVVVVTSTHPRPRQVSPAGGRAATIPSMAVPRVLVLILAGGAGNRLELLTEERAKPAVPFGGSYCLIDFVLSSCLASGVPDVWVVQQNNPGSLSEHLANGRPWDLDRTSGGLMVVHPHQGDHREGFHTGTADALWRTSPLLREHDPEVLVVVSADAVYRQDYLDVALAHRDSGALLTAVTRRHDGDVTRYGVVQVEAGRVTDYAYKPDDPASDLITTEVFALTPGPVLDVLDRLADEVDDVGDLGEHLLPELVGMGEVREHRFDGYWQDVGTVQSYWRAHQDLLGADPAFELDERDRPLFTRAGRHAPARLLTGAEVADSLLAPGVRVAGRVSGSVLSTGVVVEQGATVVDSVLLPGSVVRSGARVERAVLDSGVEVCAGASVGGPGPTDDDVALVGRGASVGAGCTVPAGGRFPED